SFIFVDDTHITATSPTLQPPGAVQVTVTTGSGTSPFTQFAYFTYTGPWLGYVANNTEGSVSVFDATDPAHPVLTTFSTGGPSSRTYGTAVNPTASTAYVSLSG